MKIEYDVMLDIVLKYCNQDYKPGKVPKGLRPIVKTMCEYAETHDSNLTSETIGNGTMSWHYAGKDLLQVFSEMLSPYKRLKTL